MDSSNQFCIHPENYLTEAQPQHGSIALSPRLKCGDCDCPIVGKAFHCAACNSDLHPFCKSCPPNFTSRLHPCPLSRLTGRGFVGRRCAVCEEEIRGGVSYTCSGCRFDIHPLCSQLPLVVSYGQHSLHLQVRNNDNPAVKCDGCSRQCFKWAYRCEVPSITLHYSCLSEKIVFEAGDRPAADHRCRDLVQPWGFCPPYNHGGGYGYGAGNYNYGGGFPGQGYGAGLPNYGHYGLPQYHYGGGFSGQGYGAGLPNYGHYGGVPQSHYGGGFSGQGYGAGLPNYGHHGVPQYHYGGSGGGFQNHVSNNAGSGSGGGAGGFMSGMIGRIGGSLAVGVLCNLFADQIQHGIFGN